MAINYKTVTYRTVDTTNDNATYHWVELSSTHVPSVSGLVRRIVIPCGKGSSSSMTREPIYLGIWERQTDGSLNLLGCSTNAVTQEVNTDSVWDFDGAIIREKPLVLSLLSQPNEDWDDSSTLSLFSRTKRDDSDGCFIVTDSGNIKVTPDITFIVSVAEFIPDEEPEPEPEQEEKHRVVDISNYWVQIIRDTDEFKQIAKAENPEFNGLLGAIYNALKDGFIIEGTEYGISRWERLLGLVVKDGMTLEDRKVQILTYLSVKSPYTWRVLKQMLNALLGEDNYMMSLDNDTQTLNMSTTLHGWDKKDEINELLSRVLPKNLDVKYDSLPMGFTELEYLESSGEEYIDTGIVPQYNTRLYLDAEILEKYESNFLTLCGCRNRTDDEDNLFVFYDVYLNSSGLVIRNYSTKYIYSTTPPVGRFVAEMNGTQTVLNGKVLNGYTEESCVLTTEIPLVLFAHRNSDGVSQNTSMRVYSFRLYDSNGEIINLVPVLDENGTACMFDKVTRKCFYNSGRGGFDYKIKSTGEIVNSPVIELEYLESSGTQWINTSLYLHGNSRVEFEAMPLQRKYTNFFFDTRRNTVSTGMFGLSYGYNGANSNTMRIVYGDQYRYIDRFRDGSSGVLTLGEKYSFLIDKGLTYKNGSPVSRYLESTAIQEQSFTSTLPCYLFASEGNGAISRFVMRMYSFTVKENDVLLLNLIPALDASGTPCMYDKLTHKCFYNSGKGTFGYRIKATGEESAPFSLRDPYHTAPSGVYVRLVAENELDIIADTDMGEDIAEQYGYTWFANSGDAYEHFNIKEVIENE